jgi:hypothetical protein
MSFGPSCGCGRQFSFLRPFRHNSCKVSDVDSRSTCSKKKKTKSPKAAAGHWPSLSSLGLPLFGESADRWQIVVLSLPVKSLVCDAVRKEQDEEQKKKKHDHRLQSSALYFESKCVFGTSYVVDPAPLMTPASIYTYTETKRPRGERLNLVTAVCLHL